MNRRYAVVMAVAAMWFTVAQATWAGEPMSLDRPDLVDFDSGFADTADSKNMAMVVVPFELYGPYVASFGGGQLDASPAVGTHGSIYWFLFEPDKTKRSKFSATAQLRQSNYVGLRAYGTTTDGGFSRYGIIDGCKGSIKVTDADANGTPENALWSASCGKDVLTQLGMTEAEKSAFEKVFGSQGVNISGNGPPMPTPTPGP